MNEEIRKNCQERFAAHKATLIQNTDRYLAIDWRDKDGRGDCYVNYILDKKRGSIIISGDLGDCIATWYNKLTVENAKEYINNVEYFIKKIQCASNKYTYDYENVISDIRKELEDVDFDVSDVYSLERGIFDMDDFWRVIEEEVGESTGRMGLFLPTDKLIQTVGSVYEDCWEWIGSCGERIHPRVYLWAVGFQMACEQLGL